MNNTIDYNSFKKYGHICTISGDFNEDTVRAFINENSDKYKAISCLKWRMVSENNGRARTSFYSQFSLDREKIRQLLYYPNVIHPFSELRKWWEIIMIFVTLISIIWFPFDNAFIDISPRGFEPLDIFRFTLNLFYILDILGNFVTGFKDRTENRACLDPTKIANNYIKSWLFFDVIISLPIKIFYKIITHNNCTYIDLIDALKILCGLKFSKYLNNFFEVMQLKITTGKIIKMISLGCLFTHWIACVQYTVVFVFRGTYDIRKHHFCWMSRHRLHMKDISYRYVVGIYRASALLFLQGFGRIYPKRLEDQLFMIFAWVSGAFLAMYMVASVLSINLGTNSSKSKYYVIINQVKAYMEKKDLPRYLQKKLIEYYKIRFHKYFYKESDILDCVSGRLRQDVVMHTCRQVVEDVPFLKQLPANLLLCIVSSMRSEIFLTNDIIIKVDTIGDCMYFIKSGTVAVYSARGRELCHLQDGAHFGEIALIGPRRRTASVVAVEACELFRLDRKDFGNAMAKHPEMLEVIARIAADRVGHNAEIDLQENFKQKYQSS